MSRSALHWLSAMIRFIAAPLLFFAGLFVIFLPFAFATMVIGDRGDEPGWAEYLGIVFSKGGGLISFGAVMIASAVWMGRAADKIGTGSPRPRTINTGRNKDPLGGRR